MSEVSSGGNGNVIASEEQVRQSLCAIQESLDRADVNAHPGLLHPNGYDATVFGCTWLTMEPLYGLTESVPSGVARLAGFDDGKSLEVNANYSRGTMGRLARIDINEHGGAPFAVKFVVGAENGEPQESSLNRARRGADEAPVDEATIRAVINAIFHATPGYEADATGESVEDILLRGIAGQAQLAGQLYSARKANKVLIQRSGGVSKCAFSLDVSVLEVVADHIYSDRNSSITMVTVRQVLPNMVTNAGDFDLIQERVLRFTTDENGVVNAKYEPKILFGVIGGQCLSLEEALSGGILTGRVPQLGDQGYIQTQPGPGHLAYFRQLVDTPVRHLSDLPQQSRF